MGRAGDTIRAERESGVVSARQKAWTPLGHRFHARAILPLGAATTHERAAEVVHPGSAMLAWIQTALGISRRVARHEAGRFSSADRVRLVDVDAATRECYFESARRNRPSSDSRDARNAIRTHADDPAGHGQST